MPKSSQQKMNYGIGLKVDKMNYLPIIRLRVALASAAVSALVGYITRRPLRTKIAPTVVSCATPNLFPTITLATLNKYHIKKYLSSPGGNIFCQRGNKTGG